MASSNTSWMPVQGRHRVKIGSSLARSLKSRKLNGEAPPPANKRSHLPDKDFYSFRYYHKPPSVDLKKPGMIDFRKKDASSTTTVILEHPSVQAGESAMFRGQESTLNKNDCVLIYDEETGTFTLEKLDACIQLTSDRSLPSIIPVGSSPTPSIPTPHGAQDATIDQDILDLVDDDRPAPSTSRTKQKQKAAPRREEEEEEEEDFPTPHRTMSAAQHTVQKVAPPSRPAKSMPIPRANPAPVAAAPPALPRNASKPPPIPPIAPPAEPPSRPRAIIGSSKGKYHQQRVLNGPPPAVEPHVEQLSLSKAAPVKQARAAAKPPKQAPAQPPPPPAPAPLALPGSFSAQTTLPSSLQASRNVPANGKGKTAAAEAVPAVAPASEVLSDSDEEEGGWDEVTTNNAVGAATPVDEEALTMLEEDIFGVVEDVGSDDDDFQRQLELEMANMQEDEDEDEDEDIDMEPAEIPDVDGPPISLNALAGGGNMNMLSDDEYSSSEESDDDD